MRRFIAIAAVVLSGVATARAQAPEVWDIDPAHSAIEFKVRHMVVSTASGSFHKFNGTLTGNPANPAGVSVSVSIDAASIDTGNPDRDDDLRSDNFFDVKKFPTLTYVSKRVFKEDGKWRVAGDLTMHGVTKEVPLELVSLGEVAKRAGTDHVEVRLRARLNRKDFGIVWNRTLDDGGVAVADEVNISLTIDFAKRR